MSKFTPDNIEKHILTIYLRASKKNFRNMNDKEKVCVNIVSNKIERILTGEFPKNVFSPMKREKGRPARIQTILKHIVVAFGYAYLQKYESLKGKKLKDQVKDLYHIEHSTVEKWHSQNKESVKTILEFYSYKISAIKEFVYLDNLQILKDSSVLSHAEEYGHLDALDFYLDTHYVNIIKR